MWLTYKMSWSKHSVERSILYLKDTSAAVLPSELKKTFVRYPLYYDTMTKHDDEFYLEGIKEHLKAIKGYLPASKEAFLGDEKTQDAILMRLMALGEEIAHLSPEFSQKYPDLHWYKMVGLRNRIAHGYFEIDPEIIWDTLMGSSLDELNRLVEKL